MNREYYTIALNQLIGDLALATGAEIVSVSTTIKTYMVSPDERGERGGTITQERRKLQLYGPGMRGHEWPPAGLTPEGRNACRTVPAGPVDPAELATLLRSLDLAT